MKMFQNKPIFKQSVASCSSDNCNCCDVYSSDYSSDESSSVTSTTETDSTCSCNDLKTGEHHERFKKHKTELSWVDHFTDRKGIVNYIKYLDDKELNRSNSSTNRLKNVQKKFKKRPNYLNKFTDWTNSIGISFKNKQESVKQIESLFENINEVQSIKINQRFIGRLYDLIKNLNTNSKSVDKLLPNQSIELKNDDYIEESGILNVICLQMQLNESNRSVDDCLKYAYCRPAGKSIDTNLLDQSRMFKLKGMHITMASIIERITNEKLIQSKIAIPRVTLLRTQEQIKIDLIYEQENDLLIKFAITDQSNLTCNQFHNLTKAILRIIKFQFKNLEQAFLNLDNQLELHKLFHIISFLLDNQFVNHNHILNSNQMEVNRELLINLHLCEQLIINVELLKCIQQVMIDFECLTWLNQFDQRTIDSIKIYSCLNSAIFYKGKLICSNIYQPNSGHSDLRLYLKLAGLITLSKIAQTKFVKWMPVYLNNDSSVSCFLLVIIVEQILYSSIWRIQTDCEGQSFKMTPKRLINEALHFIVRLVKKTSLIEEIDYDLRLQIYWYSLPVSLDEFKDKKGHILQKSFDLWNSLQTTNRTNVDLQNVNKLNQWRKALVNANIHRNVHLNNELIRSAKSSSPSKQFKQKLTGFNLLAGQQSSSIFYIYNSLRSNSTVDSLNGSSSSQQRNPLFDQNDPFAGELQCELNALSRSLKQIRTLMVDFLICYLIEDNQNAVYQSPILSSTLVERFGSSFIKKFKYNCAKLDNQINFLNVKEIGCSFEARLPLLNDHSKNNSNKKVILPLVKLNQSKSSPNLQNNLIKNRFEDYSESSSFKTVKFWLQLIKLDNDNRTIFLCFIDNHLQQIAINNFLYNNSSSSKFR